MSGNIIICNQCGINSWWCVSESVHHCHGYYMKMDKTAQDTKTERLINLRSAECSTPWSSSFYPIWLNETKTVAITEVQLQYWNKNPHLKQQKRSQKHTQKETNSLKNIVRRLHFAARQTMYEHASAKFVQGCRTLYNTAIRSSP